VPVALPPSKKTKALLAYLALAERPQRREFLCDMFWDVPDDPRGALRWSLSKIRQVLGDEDRKYITADRQSIQLRHEAVAIDAASLKGVKPSELIKHSRAELEAIAGTIRGASSRIYPCRAASNMRPGALPMRASSRRCVSPHCVYWSSG
jgi:DNA-binding SARP family transcriptional activator